jgi:transcriptional regulator with XRE-family HTH domain
MSNAIPGNLRRLMQRRDFQQAELAKRSGLSEATISRILSGEQRNPTAETLRALARALGVGVADLLAEDGRPHGVDDEAEEILLNLYRVLGPEDRAKIVEYAEAIALKRQRESGRAARLDPDRVLVERVGRQPVPAE